MKNIKTVIDQFIDIKNYKDQFTCIDIKNILSIFIKCDDILSLDVSRYLLCIQLKSAIARHMININKIQIMKLLDRSGVKINNIIVK